VPVEAPVIIISYDFPHAATGTSSCEQAYAEPDAPAALDLLAHP
jgi:hypothetical protein